MKILNPKVDPERFFSELSNASERVLLLDYDGTLAPFHVDWDKALPYDGVRPRLQKMIASEKLRVVIISGRSISDLIRLLELEELPEIWGCHGAERLGPNQQSQEILLDPGTTEGLEKAATWSIESGWESAMELKPAGIAFHWRGQPEEKARQMRGAIIEGLKEIADKASLQLRDFDGGIELIAGSVSKAKAVNAVLSEAGSDLVAAYLGDDKTDEDAFNVMADKGLSVLVRPEFRPTAADIWLRPPEELLDFLDQWYSAAGG